MRIQQGNVTQLWLYDTNIMDHLSVVISSDAFSNLKLLLSPMSLPYSFWCRLLGWDDTPCQAPSRSAAMMAGACMPHAAVPTRSKTQYQYAPRLQRPHRKYKFTWGYHSVGKRWQVMVSNQVVPVAHYADIGLSSVLYLVAECSGG